MSFLRQAFETAIEGVKTPDVWYVTLVQESRYYGGPEEGGWWGTDTHVIAYRDFPSRELAVEAAAAVKKLASELEEESRKEHGEQCLREMEWLDARGLDADFLPEPDGPDDYRVLVSQELVQERCGPRHYE